MPTDSDKLSRFWQELKRRKVVRVITVYAAAAFVILELVDIIADPFGLPDWTLKFVFVLLAVGLIVSIILSWIYDIHPEGGIVKTEPAPKVTVESTPSSSKGWKTASYISFLVIVGLIVFNIIPRSEKREILEKSIAVLPFINDSPDQEKMYFINGTMEEILDNLSRIEDLRVVSRTSVEQYRYNPKTIPEIAEEMNVSYVLEGSGQREENKIRLTVQLLDARNDRHVWSESYHREIEDIFALQSEIAQLIAKEIRVVITPQEIQLIEKKPTTNLTAYDFYQRGREENWGFLYYRDPAGLERAENYFYQALAYDPSFAQAYAGLASVYWNKHYTETYLSDDFLDSAVILADHALSLDDQVSAAYLIKGRYYSEMGDMDRALEEFDKALMYNPNDWEVYTYKAVLFSPIDQTRTVENLHKALQHNRGPALPGLLRGLSGVYDNAGFSEKSAQILDEAFQLDHDSLFYYRTSASIESNRGNFSASVALFEKALLLDSSDVTLFRQLGYNCMFAGQYQKSVRYYEKWLASTNLSDGMQFVNMHRVGYAYYKAGQIQESESYFDKQLNYCLAIMELDRSRTSQLWIYYDLAGVYAFRGEREKAYENLRIFNNRETIPQWMVTLIHKDPLFDSIRDEPEFQQIVRDVEAKYQAERERVRQWLEENDML